MSRFMRAKTKDQALYDHYLGDTFGLFFGGGVVESVTTVESMEKSEYEEVWLRVMHAGLNGLQTTGMFLSPRGVRVRTSKLMLSWKTDAKALIT